MEKDLLITEEQALGVALALISGEKEKQDYGFGVLKESKEILEGKLFLLQEENKIEKKPRPSWFVQKHTPEIYDKYFPLYGGVSMRKRKPDKN